MQRHGVHELQARALVGAPQQRAAVAMDQPHPLQRSKEPLPNLLLLEVPSFTQLSQQMWCLADAGGLLWANGPE